MGKYDNDVSCIEKNILLPAKENFWTLMPSGRGSDCITNHKNTKSTCQSTLIIKFTSWYNLITCHTYETTTLNSLFLTLKS
jgi:hypothetical protein